MKTVTVDVKEDGSWTVSTAGFSGQECQRETADLEFAMGKRVSERLLWEFWQRAVKKQQVGS